MTDECRNFNFKGFRCLQTYCNEGRRDEQLAGGKGEAHPECEEECQTFDGGERH